MIAECIKIGLIYRRKNILFIVLQNLVSVCLLCLYFLLERLLCGSPFSAAALKIFFFFCFEILAFFISTYSAEHEKNKKETVLCAILSAVVKYCFICIFLFLIKVSLKMENFLGSLLLFFTFFILFFYFFSSLWLMPVLIFEKCGNVFSALQKAAGIFIQKPIFTFFVFLYSIFLSAVSPLSFMLFPGLAGIVSHFNSAYICIKSKEKDDFPCSKD